jgi:uncharacterized protein
MQFIHWFNKIWNEDIYYEKSILPWVPCKTLVLHGAGKSDITRMSALREALHERWIPTLAIDFSWHGQSTHHEDGSIQKRISEARAIAQKFLDTTMDIQIIGFSMSGEVAMRLTEYFNMRSIILFAPGIYDKNAINIPFWEKFSQMIRNHESWRNHDLANILEKYEWSLYLCTPELDHVIPEWVNDEIMSVAPKAYKKRIIIQSAPHMVGKWMNEHPEMIDAILDQIHIQ